MSLEGIRSFRAALSMKYRVVIFLLAALVAPAASTLCGYADTGAQSGEIKVVTPEARPAEVNVVAARNNLVDADRVLLEAQAQLTVRDAEYGRLFTELRTINSNATARRAELDLLFKSKTEWLAAEKKRGEAYAALLQARQTEQALHRQLTAEDAASTTAAVREGNAAEKVWIGAVDARQQAQVALDQAEQELLRVQHTLSYEDPAGKRLHAEIKQMEGDLLRVRQAKAVREKLDSLWRTADLKRRQAHATLKEAQLQARVAGKELGVVAGKTDGVPAVETENP